MMKTNPQATFCLSLLFLISLAQASPTSQPAFPGAEGFGSTTPGGRDGQLYEVTTLADSGPGSLRDAVSQSHRIITFGVAGTIELKSKINVTQPYLTIDAQTAPGEGICLRGYTFLVSTHDVIVRYLRSRLGDLTGQEDDCMGCGKGARNVIYDHCSATWSVDEALSLAGDVSDVTIQWCLIAEPLNRSIHHKGPHAYGSLSRANGPVTWHHNLWAHCDQRSPRLGDNYGKPPFPRFDVRNNVIYDYGQICSGFTQGDFEANYVANYICPGPASTAATPIHVGDPSNLRFHIKDNVVEGNDRFTADNSLFFDHPIINGKQQVTIVPEAFDMAPVQTTSAREAFEAVLADVGATHPVRDSVDTRIIADVRARRGKIIDSQKDVGGWPDLKPTTAPTTKPTQPAATRPTGAAVYQTDIEYANIDNTSLRLDACVPRGAGPFPIAIIIHGGGWTSGDKQRDITPLFQPLTTAGYTWFSINYRLAPQSRWPACLDDVQTAIRWIKSHAKDYNSDPNRLALIGHSAGGHLAFMAAVSSTPETQIQAAIGLAPVTDFEQDFTHRGGLSKSLQALLNRPNIPTDDLHQLLKETSPITHLKPALPPFLILQGDADKTVPIEQSQNFLTRLKETNIPGTLIPIKGAPHAVLAWDKFDPSWKDQLMDWLRQTFPAKL